MSCWHPSSLVLVTWLTIAVSATFQIHHEMSSEELQRVFHVPSHDQVPQYEVVDIRSRVQRDVDRDIRHVDLSAFGSSYNLRLERNDQLLRSGNKVRVWVADSPGSNVANASASALPFITLEELVQVRANHFKYSFISHFHFIFYSPS